MQYGVDAGGTVRIPAGRYRVNTLHLRPNVELHLEKGAGQ
jgi:polygalacturonase